MMKKVLTTVFCAVFLQLAYSQAQEDRAQTVPWLTFEQLSDSLDVRPRKVLLFFHTDWCAYCRKMEREVFTNPMIVEKIIASYYAVRFDAEHPDPVWFDGQEFKNLETTRRRKGFHQLARILAGRSGQMTVPVTILLDEEFKVIERHFEYLGPRKLSQILE